MLFANSVNHIRLAKEHYPDLDFVVVSDDKKVVQNDPNFLSILSSNIEIFRESLDVEISYLSFKISSCINIESAKSTIALYAGFARGQLIVLDNYYDSDAMLENIELKTVASNLSQNRVRLLVDDYIDIAKSLDCESISIFGINPIFSNFDSSILPLSAPENYWPGQDKIPLRNHSEQESEIPFLTYRYLFVVYNLNQLHSSRQDSLTISPNLKNFQLIAFRNFAVPNFRLSKQIKDNATIRLLDSLKANSNDSRVEVLEIATEQTFSTDAETFIGNGIHNSHKFVRQFHVPPVYISLLKQATIVPPHFNLLSANEQIIEETLYLSQREKVQAFLRGNSQVMPQPVFSMKTDESEYAFLLSNPGFNNYYHWTLQCLASAALLPYVKRLYGIKPCILVPPMNQWRRRGLELAGLSDYCIKVLQPCVQQLTNLIYPSLLSGQHSFCPWPGIVDFFGTLCKNSHQEVRVVHKPSQFIYIARFDSNIRRLANEEELAEKLSKLGFQILNLSQLSLDEQIQVFSKAKVIIAPHGAGLSNIVYCKPETLIFELFPKSYVNPCFFSLTSVFQLKYHAQAFDVENPLENEHQHKTFWHVDVDFVLKHVENFMGQL